MYWTLALAAVPVVYVLTAPPFMIVIYKLTGRPVSAPGYAWEEVFMAPYSWAAAHTPLGNPLYQYLDWWVWVTGFNVP